jgi:hypothetical protein
MKIIPVFLIFNLLFISTSPYMEIEDQIHQEQLLINTFEQCYGFIIPLPNEDNESLFSDLQYGTMNLINDLLREGINVYWSTHPSDLMIQEMDDEINPMKQGINEGTFIVPFEENATVNYQIVAIISDYTISHELHTQMMPVHASMIVEPIILKDFYIIHEPNIAYYFGDGVYINSLNWYLSTLYKAGFLSNTLLNDTDVIDSLNNQDFNAFIWPGGEIIEDINSDISLPIRIAKNQAITHFVRNGGGYVGSCYGAFTASSGMRVFPFPLIKFLLPSIPSLGYLSMQDSLTALAISCTVNISIEDSNHPVLFGADNVLSHSQLRGGPVFTYVGKNTQSLATVQDVNAIIWTHWFRDLFNTDSALSQLIIDLWVQFTIGKTIWTTSSYGDGEIVLFGDHPELGAIPLKRIIHNALFYVVSEPADRIQRTHFLPITQVQHLADKTTNLPIPHASSDLFHSVYEDIDAIVVDFNGFHNRSDYIFNLTWALIEQEKMNFSLAIDLFVSGLWEFSGSLGRSTSYLNNGMDNQDTIAFLKKIANIIKLLDEKNLSDADIILTFKDLIGQHVRKITAISRNISHTLDVLEENLEHFENTQDQNETLVSASETLWYYAKETEKNCPSLYFESLKMMREMWYYYEAFGQR